jgi:hypothetical protein
MKLNFLSLILLISFNSLIAKDQVYSINQSDYTNEEYTCFLQYMVRKGYNNDRPFKPSNENLQTMIISFQNKMDNMKVEGTNEDSTFEYQKFIDLPNDSMGIKKGTLGITYYGLKSDKSWLYYDIFENGKLLIWLDNQILDEFFCPNLKLDIKKVK